MSQVRRWLGQCISFYSSQETNSPALSAILQTRTIWLSFFPWHPLSPPFFHEKHINIKTQKHMWLVIKLEMHPTNSLLSFLRPRPWPPQPRNKAARIGERGREAKNRENNNKNKKTRTKNAVGHWETWINCPRVKSKWEDGLAELRKEPDRSAQAFNHYGS